MVTLSTYIQCGINRRRRRRRRTFRQFQFQFSSQLSSEVQSESGGTFDKLMCSVMCDEGEDAFRGSSSSNSRSSPAVGGGDGSGCGGSYRTIGFHKLILLTLA